MYKNGGNRKGKGWKNEYLLYFIVFFSSFSAATPLHACDELLLHTTMKNCHLNYTSSLLSSIVHLIIIELYPNSNYSVMFYDNF